MPTVDDEDGHRSEVVARLSSADTAHNREHNDMNNAQPSSWDPTWEQVFRTQEWGKYPPEYLIRFIARNFYWVPDRQAVHLLDLGCGSGACAWYMAREGFRVAGIDGSETAIQRAAKRLADENLKADMRCGDYTRLPWPDASFDAVVDNVTLCCNRFEDCRRAVAEVRRVLKPGGRFLSCNFTDRTWGYGTGEAIEPGTFTGIREGPLAGKGLAFFMGRSEIDRLYSDFMDRQIERLSWTVDNMAHSIELWIVTCRK